MAHHGSGLTWDVDVPSFMIGEFTPVPLSRRNVRLFNQKGPRHAQSTQSPFERKRCAGKAAVATWSHVKSDQKKKAGNREEKLEGRSPLLLLPPLRTFLLVSQASSRFFTSFQHTFPLYQICFRALNKSLFGVGTGESVQVSYQVRYRQISPTAPWNNGSVASLGEGAGLGGRKKRRYSWSHAHTHTQVSIEVGQRAAQVLI